MILVELDNGTRREFNSSTELAEAIGRGEVGPSARIYHHLREQWLPITQHPEFQRRRGNGDRPLPPLERTRWTFFSVEPDEAHRLATTELRRPGSVETPETASSAPAAAQQAQPTPRWHRAIGSAMRRLRPKSSS
jgi:hypothetical protein